MPKLTFARLTTCSVVFVLSAMVLAPASALVTRADVDDSAFADLASQEPFNATGGFLINGNLDSSGVLIAPNLVLGAAHSGAAANTAGRTFVIDGQSFTIDSIQRLDPTSTDATDGRDAALFTLSAPVAGIAPATVFQGTVDDLLGEEVVFTGTGVSGDSDNPPSVNDTAPFGTLLAGTNVIDAAGITVADESGGSTTFADSIIFADFDDPNSSVTNTLGSAAATGLEVQATLGDSGGGVFVFNDATDQFELAALHSFVLLGDADGRLGFGSATASTTFSPEDLSLIQAAIPEPAALTILGIGGLALMNRRRQAR